MKSFNFTCELDNGVHARPAAYIDELCNQFTAKITWENKRTGLSGNAKSTLSIIGTDTLKGDECVITIDGDDEEKALEKIQDFITNEFPDCDSPLQVNIEESGEFPPLSRTLTNLAQNIMRGNPVSAGFGRGVLTKLGSVDLNALTDLPKSEGTVAEHKKLEEGIHNLGRSVEYMLSSASSTEMEVLKAHLAIIKDIEFVEILISNLEGNASAAQAIVATAQHYTAQLQRSESAYLRERELDIRDISFQLLQSIYGAEKYNNEITLEKESICVADDLTPSQFLELDKSKLKGLILTHGGSTSHTVILARSFAIPTIVGVTDPALSAHFDEEIILDGNLGAILTDLSEEVSRYYNEEQRVLDVVNQRQEKYREGAILTADGKHIEVAANIAHSVEAKSAFGNGAEAIGLFRTEMLYMDRNSEPDEEELYQIFCEAIDAAQGKSIIVRTMDIGGDKPVDYLNIPAENNPFLGYRAVRIYEEFLEIFKTQMRAIMRASAHGDIKVMVPMISSLEEILWVKDIMAELRQELRKEELNFAERIPLGIMVEVPSVMFIIDQFCEEIDFFSIGSNDLTQYLMAVDRDNAKVVKNYDSLNPAFLRALDYIVSQVHHHGKFVGLCGELGAKGSVLPLLVGLGLDEISMSAPNIPATKERLERLDTRECRQLLNKAMQCRTSQEVEHLLAQFRMDQSDAPLVTKDCITLDNDLRSKDEVIKTLTGNLYLAGRCRYPDKLADDLWAREDVFSTGLGFGFAIPHTKSEHIEQSTVSVSRLANPIAWGDEEASFIIMLTLNKHAAGNQHMKIFSKLARKIMHADFREALMSAESPQAIESMLITELEL